VAGLLARAPLTSILRLTLKHMGPGFFRYVPHRKDYGFDRKFQPRVRSDRVLERKYGLFGVCFSGIKPAGKPSQIRKL
jgi:hypothetical protein